MANKRKRARRAAAIVDGVPLRAGDAVLVTNQRRRRLNGVWIADARYRGGFRRAGAVKGDTDRLEET